jgi:hypothetical protein
VVSRASGSMAVEYSVDLAPGRTLSLRRVMSLMVDLSDCTGVDTSHRWPGVDWRGSMARPLGALER